MNNFPLKKRNIEKIYLTSAMTEMHTMEYRGLAVRSNKTKVGLSKSLLCYNALLYQGILHYNESLLKSSLSATVGVTRNSNLLSEENRY